MIVRRVGRPDTGTGEPEGSPTHNHHNIMAQKNRVTRLIGRPVIFRSFQTPTLDFASANESYLNCAFVVNKSLLIYSASVQI